MVPGSGSRIARRLISVVAVVLVSACASTPVVDAEPVETAPFTTGAGTTPDTTTTAPTTTMPITTSTSRLAPDFEDLPDIGLEIRLPDSEAPFPAVVLAHGGGWVGGSPALMSDLARFLTNEGFLTVNAPYALSNGIPGFPIAVDDLACAVRYAAIHPEADGTVAIIGHSAGAHLAALVALDDRRYGADCPVEEPFIPDRLVGLAGPYDIDRLGPLMLPFFGVRPTEDPEVWVEGNPLSQVASNPSLSSLLMYGAEDVLVDSSFAFDFAEALSAAGSEALVEVVEGARHSDMHNPQIVGDLIVTWLERD